MTNPLPNDPQVEQLNRVQILSAMGITAVVLLVVSWLWRIVGQVALLNIEFTGLALLAGVGLGFGITAASAVVYWLWDDYRSSADYYLQMVLKPLAWIDLIWLGLLPGLSEELLFRGVMIPGLGFNAIALIISSLCFGVLHYNGSQNWSYVIWATAIGLVLGYSALVTGNLLVPITAHVVTNLISSVTWKIATQSVELPSND